MRNFIVLASLIFLGGCVAYASSNMIHVKAEKASYGLASIVNGEMTIIREMCTKDFCEKK